MSDGFDNVDVGGRCQSKWTESEEVGPLLLQRKETCVGKESPTGWVGWRNLEKILNRKY